jgi:hypothetical protein
MVSQPAQAGCGLDPICHISESIGNGAGRGVAESVRPLVTEVMGREAPALIAQLQASVDHNIMTAEEAGEKLTAYATNLLNKAADDVLENAQDRTQKLLAYALDQTITIERQVFHDVQKIIDQLQCATLGVNALIERQQKIFDESVNTWLQRVLFWQNRKNAVEALCRTKFRLSPDLSTSGLGVPTTFKLWRCVRLGYVDEKEPATAVYNAFIDLESNGRAMMCALRGDEALRAITEIWIDDAQSAKAWGRAIRGE